MRSLRGLRWFVGICTTFMTAAFGVALWQTWEDAHGGEAVANVQQVDQFPPGPTSGLVTITDDAYPTGLPPWRYTSVFVLPDGTRCETTAMLFPADRRVVVGDATAVHYSRWHPCSNFQRADRPRADVTSTLVWGANTLFIGLVVFATLTWYARTRSTSLETARETGPDDHGPAEPARHLPGWRP